MAIETKEKAIDGKRVTVTQLPARRALKLQTKLVKLLGSSVAALVSGSKGSMTMELDPTTLAVAMEKLADHLDEEQFAQLVREVLQSTRVDNQELNDAVFDLLFAGNFLFMYKVIGFTLQVNYGDFFGEGGIGGLLTKVPPMTTAVPV